MKSRKPAPSSTLCCLLRQATRAVSQAWKWRTNGLRRVRTAIVAGISWRFATDYNLVAEIWHGEHRQWTESEASCIVL